MANNASAVPAIIDLRPARYQSSLNMFRMLFEASHDKSPTLWAGVRSPREEVVEFHVRYEDLYVVDSKGADGWYHFDGETEGVQGRPCGIGSNYNQLGQVGKVVYDDLNRLGELAQFRKGGASLDKRLCAILFAVTSEAARFATVATYFTGLTNSVGTAHSQYLQGGVDFEYLRYNYFSRWANPPENKMEPGEIYHFTKGEILLPRYR